MGKKSGSVIEKHEVAPSTQFEVLLAADVSTITPVVNWVMHLVGEFEYGESKEHSIELALRDALANAVLHGCNMDPSKRIECSVTSDEKRGILIVVRDPDPAKASFPANERPIFCEFGRGIFLINMLMQEMSEKQSGAEILMRS